jgi:hypothetical protein
LRRANRATGRGFASGVAACRCRIGQRTRRPMQMRPGRFGPHRFAPRRVYCRTRSGSRCVRAVGGRRRQSFSGGRLHSATQFEGRLDAPECFLGAAAAIADDVAVVEEATRHALIDGDRFDLSSSSSIDRVFKMPTFVTTLRLVTAKSEFCPRKAAMPTRIAPRAIGAHAAWRGLLLKSLQAIGSNTIAVSSTGPANINQYSRVR